MSQPDPAPDFVGETFLPIASDTYHHAQGHSRSFRAQGFPEYVDIVFCRDADYVGCETCRRRKVRCKRPESTSVSVDESSTSSAPSTTTPPGPEQILPACVVSCVEYEEHSPRADIQPCLAIGEDCVTVYNRRRVSFSADGVMRLGGRKLMPSGDLLDWQQSTHLHSYLIITPR